jgi:proteasome lid subunit RPN8/RPN11
VRERSAVVLAGGRLVRWRTGGAAHVDFDWAWVLRREEARGDVAGFFHTHPAGLSSMSERDRQTMGAWALSFGKPLLCAIRCGRRVRAWRCDGSRRAIEASEARLAKGRLSWKE